MAVSLLGLMIVPLVKGEEVAAEEQGIEEIVVYGAIISGERAALERQRDSSRIMNVVNADGIGKLPDRNAAEAVARVPGVSIERDQGEGRFVAVRGLPSQWNATTLNGNRLPTAEEETTSRATAFDFFPSELIERIEVSKTQTPDLEGDALGGSVNFVTRTAPEERLFAISTAANYNQKTDKAGYNTSLVYGDRTGDGRFGFLLNGTAWRRDWATDNFEPRRGADGIGTRRLELRDYTGQRNTYGINGALEFVPDEDHRLFARAQYGTLIDDEKHYKHLYRFDRNRIELQNIHNELTTEFTTFEIGGEHGFGESQTLNWSLSSATNEFYYGCIPTCDERAYFVVRFDQRNVAYTGLENRRGEANSYNVVDGGRVDPQRPDTHLPAGFVMNPTVMALTNVELYKVDVEEKDKLVLAVDYTIDLDERLSVKWRDKERTAEFADEFYVWNRAAGPVPVLGSFNLINQPGRGEFDIGVRNTYSDGFSQVADPGDLRAWFVRNRNNLVLDRVDSALISNGGALGRNFDVQEEQLAGYAMATWTPADTFELVGGLRVVRTDTTVFGQVLETNTTTRTSELVDVEGGRKYTSLLPQVQFRWSLRDDLDLRGAITRTFARPDFGNLNPGGTFAEHDLEFFSGNASLKPTYANGIDLSLEWYPGDIALVSAGIFYKDITDPIFQSSSVGTFRDVSGVRFFRPENGDDAKLWGAEFAFVKQFDSLPGWMQYLGINANLTLMDSEMKISGRAGDVAIPRQADLLYNVTAYYDDGNLALRLALNHKDEFIEEHGASSSFDSYYGKYTSLDFSASYVFDDHWSVFLELNNLTNEPLKYYLGEPGRPLQVEYYELRGQLGVRFAL
jgi:TonB-dependent receptor